MDGCMRLGVEFVFVFLTVGPRSSILVTAYPILAGTNQKSELVGQWLVGSFGSARLVWGVANLGIDGRLAVIAFAALGKRWERC